MLHDQQAALILKSLQILCFIFQQGLFSQSFSDLSLLAVLFDKVFFVPAWNRI